MSAASRTATYPCTDEGERTEPASCARHPASKMDSVPPQRRADAPRPGRPPKRGTDSLVSQTGAWMHLRRGGSRVQA